MTNGEKYYEARVKMNIYFIHKLKKIQLTDRKYDEEQEDFKDRVKT